MVFGQDSEQMQVEADGEEDSVDRGSFSSDLQRP